MVKTLRIATRKSPMALWQAHFIKANIQRIYPDLSIQLIELVTQGDKDLSTALVNLGGKSLFVKELQQALLNDQADIAVHCIKDMSVHAVPGLKLAAVCQRSDPRDALISHQKITLRELPHGAVVGTASPRRQSLLLAMRPDLTIKLLRGNVNTRLQKLDAKNYDAIVLAAAGLERLSLAQRIHERFDPNTFIPAIGQGALGIECRANDTATLQKIAFLHHSPTAACIDAERAVNQTLGGDCHTPIGAYAQINDGELRLKAVVGSMDGKTLLRAEANRQIEQAAELGIAVAEELIAQGAKKLLA